MAAVDKDNQALLNELTRGFEDLKLAFDLYFQGLERKPPVDKRTELAGKLRKAKESNTRNTALKFRINQLWASFQTYDTKWNRILKEIEEGTYKRDRFKVKLRNREEQEQTGGLDENAAGAEARKQEAFEIEDLDFDVEEGDDGHVPATAVVKPRAPASPFTNVPVSSATAQKPASPFGNMPVSSATARPANAFGNVPVSSATARAPGANPAAPGAPRPVAAGANPAAPGAPRPVAAGANPAAPGAPRTMSNGGMPAVQPRPAAPGANPAAPGAARTMSNGAMPAVGARPVPPGTPGGPAAAPRPVPPGTPGSAAPRPAIQPAGVAGAPRATNGQGIPVPRPVAAAAGANVSDDAVRRIHSELTETKRKLGDTSPSASFESLKAQLNKQAPAIKQQHNAKDVDFKVEVKDGKAVLKAIPKK